MGSLLMLLQMSQTFENLPTYITGLTLLVQEMDEFLVLRYVVNVSIIFAADIASVRLHCVFKSSVALQLETCFECLLTLRTREESPNSVMVLTGLFFDSFIALTQSRQSLSSAFRLALPTEVILRIFLEFFILFFCLHFTLN